MIDDHDLCFFRFLSLILCVLFLFALKSLGCCKNGAADSNEG